MAEVEGQEKEIEVEVRVGAERLTELFLREGIGVPAAVTEKLWLKGVWHKVELVTSSIGGAVLGSEMIMKVRLEGSPDNIDEVKKALNSDKGRWLDTPLYLDYRPQKSGDAKTHIVLAPQESQDESPGIRIDVKKT